MHSPGLPPKWLVLALAENGVRRQRSPASCARIEEYHRSVGRHDWNDRIPWCSSFVNWCLRETGIGGTDSAVARSWLDWGKSLEQPVPGCIVILWRGSPRSKLGHVGLFVRETGSQICLLGGNQRGAVCERW